MTQEEKQLLLADLCARLPYGVKFNYGGNDGCDYKAEIVSLEAINDSFPLEDCKPYLRLMSSMTEEEKKEFQQVIEIELKALAGPGGHTIESAAGSAFEVDFYNRHHFDYRGLIEKGLALEAKEGMYD